MPRGYPQNSIRESCSLSDEQWRKVLTAMTGPCSVRELTEATGLERHTAEAIRMKVLFAIASAQESIQLSKPSVLYHSTVKTSQKGVKQGFSSEKGRFHALILQDESGLCVGTSVPPGSIAVQIGLMQQRSVTVTNAVFDWMRSHNGEEAGLGDDNSATLIAWCSFLMHFRGIATKYLDKYVAWFCFLRSAEVIGKKTENIACELWALINETERTVSNRRR